MARKKKEAAEPLPTIWNVDDQLWAKAECFCDTDTCLYLIDRSRGARPYSGSSPRPSPARW